MHVSKLYLKTIKLSLFLSLQEIEVTQRKIECETLYKEIDDARTQCNRLVSTDPFRYYIQGLHSGIIFRDNIQGYNSGITSRDKIQELHSGITFRIRFRDNL